ncbi:TetR family transcriptional regulator [Mycobacteroides abscessus]|nr:TetR family transcriptional regulator [Mycobacteroides abscessus]ANO27084.1 TetR family transcriptional regulator [Mycobacteroides abscessus]
MPKNPRTPGQKKSPGAPATRRTRQRAQTIDEIKSLARQQLATKGTGGLSLRGIAREMGMAPAALFRYFDDQSALITALCVDAFNTLADTMAEARDHTSQNPAAQLRSTCVAYRSWALAHPGQFALISGTPIPGYRPEAADTAPAAVRPILTFAATYLSAVDCGAAEPDRTAIHPIVPGPLLVEILPAELSANPVVIGVVISAWSSIVGFLAGEVFGSLRQLVNDVDPLFYDHLTAVMHGMGFIDL